jgi:hypothetical protein
MGMLEARVKRSFKTSVDFYLVNIIYKYQQFAGSFYAKMQEMV